MASGSHSRPASVALFSRDARTHTLFRGAWMEAIETEGMKPHAHLRGAGLRGMLRYIYDFTRRRGAMRLVFGTAEVVLLSPFASEEDIFVIPGLGRLLQRGGARAKLVSLYLRMFDRGQRLVVLNPDDKTFLERVFQGDIEILNGEGYIFTPLPTRDPPTGSLRLAYAGRLLKSKGVDTLIEACELISGDFSLLLMGDLDFGNTDAIDAEWLERRIAQSGGRIRHVGFVDDVRRRLAEIDVLVSLSEREGMPFGVMDGINAGCAILITDVPGHREYAPFEGVTFTKADRAELAARISGMAADPDRLLAFDAEARLAACRAKFGFEVIVSRIREILFGQDRADVGNGANLEA